MPEVKKFDLSHFLNESLSLDLENISQTRAMYSKKYNDNVGRLAKMNPYDVLGETKFEEPRNIPEYILGTPIQEFYRGAHVLISGGTGFIGKILTEKLVRSVPHLGRIYLLIRAKRGKSARQRFEQLLEDPVFRRMKAEMPNYAGKLTVVEGDISAPRLGLSPEDERTLVDHVTVVFHSAADVRFVEPLKVAVASNITGSRNMLALAHRMGKLKAYVHVSTAYSQCVRRVVEETVPKLSLHYQEILNMIESLSNQEVEDNLQRILQGWPNTYTFTKAICEEMVMEEGKGMPICIFRPSAVVNTYHEPVRGWTDNMYGPIGLVLAASMGVVHIFQQDDEIVQDKVPVDFTVNCLLASAWHSITQRSNETIAVYNFVAFPSSAHNSWKRYSVYGELIKDVFPIQQSIWYYSCSMVNIFIVDEIMHVLFHKIPGIILDKVAVLNGQKPKLTKIYDRIHGLKTHLRFFTTRMWEFKSENVQSMLSVMTREDKALFNFDMRNFDCLEHVLISKLGCRYYYLKEDMDSLPRAQRKNTVLFWLHNSLKCLFGLAMLKVLTVVAHALPI